MAKINEYEAVVKHDVIAFLTSVADYVGEDSAYLHRGMTSSDVLDTCLALQLAQSTDRILEGIDKLLAALKRRAEEHKMTPMIGRSHGIHAEPITFGLVMARWYAEMKRNRERLVQARAEIAVGAISGAVGTFAHLDPSVEAYVCEKLGLAVEPVSTQVIPRDRHAAYFSALAVIAGSIENIAINVRHFQRTEVLEAEEYFSPGQKGSSAMPHKRNPILSENLTGLARMMRMFAQAALENIPLWHERDISHSSVERVIGPDATVLLDFMLARVFRVVDGLIVYPDNMKKHLEKLHGLVHSQQVLLALADKGVSREESYARVQRNAMQVWEKDLDFLTLLKQDPEVVAVLGEAELNAIFDIKQHMRHIDTIFARVFA